MAAHSWRMAASSLNRCFLEVLLIFSILSCQRQRCVTVQGKEFQTYVHDAVRSKEPHHHQHHVSGRDTGRDRLGQALPGLVLGGKLFLLGVQLGSTYDYAAEAFVDTFAMARECLMTMKAHEGQPECWTEDAQNRSVITPQYDNLLLFGEVAILPLFCIVHGKEADSSPIPMEHVPLDSHDGNQGWSTHIWRCNVSSVVSREQWQHWPPSAAIRISIMADGGDIVTRVDLPVHRGAAAGLHHIRKTPTILPYEKSVTLCAGGISRLGYPFLREFVVHHLQVGVGRIMLGLYTNQSDPEVALVRRNLAPWLRTGAVVLVYLNIPAVPCRGFDTAKLHFYHSCLFRAKATSEFAAFHDIDEYWLPAITVEEAATNETAKAAALSPRALPNALRAPGSVNCPHWCYKTFPSYSIYPLVDSERDDALPRTNINAQDFPVRWVNSEENWKKSMARTKSAHMGGMHVQGSCLSGLPPPGPKYNGEGINGDCIVQAWDRGAFHHAVNMIYNRWTVEDLNVTTDEYGAIFLPRVKAALAELPALELLKNEKLE